MKQTGICPKCSGAKLFVVDNVHRRHETDDLVDVVPMTVTAAMVDIDTGGLLPSVERQTVEAGRYEAWVCASCGFTEWYARRLEELAVLAAAGKEVRVVERRSESGPYRR